MPIDRYEHEDLFIALTFVMLGLAMLAQLLSLGCIRLGGCAPWATTVWDIVTLVAIPLAMVFALTPVWLADWVEEVADAE